MIKVRFDLVCDGCEEIGLTAPRAKDQIQLVDLARAHGWGYKGGHKPTWFCPRCSQKLKAKGEKFTFDNDDYATEETSD